MKKSRRISRLIALIVALCMMFSLIPAAFANSNFSLPTTSNHVISNTEYRWYWANPWWNATDDYTNGLSQTVLSSAKYIVLDFSNAPSGSVQFGLSIGPGWAAPAANQRVTVNGDSSKRQIVIDISNAPNRATAITHSEGFRIYVYNNSPNGGVLTSAYLTDTPPSGSGSGTANFPFPQAGRFSLAVPRVMPPTSGTNARTQAQMNQDVIDQFKKILQDFIIDPASDSVNNPDNFRMALWHTAGGGASAQQVTCSESMGYGMLMLALMAGSDDHFRGNSNSSHNLRAVGGRQLTIKDYFDGMFRSLMRWPTTQGPSGNRRMMAWELVTDRVGGPWRDTGSSASSATDGDLDMAYALLLADRQWGSNGRYNYRQYAEWLINDLWVACVDNNVSPNRNHLRVGNWASSGNWTLGTRPSDFMLSHLKVFRQVTPSRNWQLTINATYDVINQITAQQSPRNGLLPGFCVVNRSTGVWSVAPANWLEGNDNRYDANACRMPWRLGKDIMLFGNTTIGSGSTQTTSGAITQALHNFLMGSASGNTGGTFSGIRGNFLMNGTGGSGGGWTMYASPVLVTAAIYGTPAQMGDGWNFARTRSRAGDQYGDYINVLSMITASGNYWNPLTR